MLSRCTSFLLVGLAFVLSSCASIPDSMRPEIQNVRPRIARLDFQGVDLAFDFDVDNPLPIPIRAPKFQYALAVQNSPFLSQTVASGIDIPASATGKASLPVRLSYMDLFRVVQNLRAENQASYQLSGALLPSVAGQNFQLPFSHSGTVPIVRPPKFSIVDLKTSSGALGSMGLDITADVENPNVFNIGVDGLSYALKMGGLEVGRVGASTNGAVGAGGTGRIQLAAQATGVSALQGLLGGSNFGQLSLIPTGAIQTPYGPIRLP